MSDLAELIRLRMIIAQTFKGGSGSGNFGHAGRPGEIGGSAGDNKNTSLYHGGSAKIIDDVLANGLKPGKEWFGRNPSVYSSTNPEEAFGYAITAARNTYELGRGKTVKGVVFEINPPENELQNFIADKKQSENSWRLERNIPKEWITGYKIYSLTIDDKFFKSSVDNLNKLWVVEADVKLKELKTKYFIPVIYYEVSV